MNNVEGHRQSRINAKHVAISWKRCQTEKRLWQQGRCRAAPWWSQWTVTNAGGASFAGGYNVLCRSVSVRSRESHCTSDAIIVFLGWFHEQLQPSVIRFTRDRLVVLRFRPPIGRISNYPRRLCRSAWVGFLSPSVCLSVRSITEKRMISKCSELV